MAEQNDENLENIAKDENLAEETKESRKKRFSLSDSAIKTLKNLLMYFVVAIVAFAVPFLISKNLFWNQNEVTEENLQQYDESGPIDVFQQRPIGSDWAMDEMLINTADEDDPHIIKCLFVVSHEEKNSKVLSQLSARKTEIHSEIRNIIGSKKYKELNTTEKQKLLAKEIKTKIQLIIGIPGIIDVFIKDFTVH